MNKGVFVAGLEGSFAVLAAVIFFEMQVTAAALNPVLEGTWPAGTALGVAVTSRQAYVADGDAGLQVLDVSDSANPRKVGGYATGNRAYGVAASGRYAYVADASSLQVIDVNDPANPRPAGVYHGSEPSGVAVSGQYAYLSDYAVLFEIIDVSNPLQPHRVGGYNSGPGLGFGVAVSGHYAYVARGTGGTGGGALEILDVNNPASPQLAGRYSGIPGFAHGVALSGDYAYVASLGSGLNIIDITDRTNPRLAGSVAAGYAEAVAVAGRYAYVAGGNGGLVVIDISNPTDPKSVGTFGDPRAPSNGAPFSGVAISDGHVYLADGGLFIFSDLSAIRLEAASPFSAGAFQLQVSGPAGLVGRIERATDASNWLTWKSITLGATPVAVSDTEINSQGQFYRFVAP
jgi:hypothetical protein